MTIIDLNERRSGNDKPDPEWVRHDDYGRPMYHYGLSYTFEDGKWAAEIWAYSMEDAQNRVDAMRQSLVLLGQTHAIIPA